MAGVPVQASSPISPCVPTRASAISPSTSAARYTPASAATTTTAVPSQSQAAQPGAPSVPQPTRAAVIPVNGAPLPTPTQPLAESSNPPAPQPGAAPVPQNITRYRGASLPISTRTTTSPPSVPYFAAPLPAHQYAGHFSTPTRSIPPASVTSTYSGPQDLSHPPGYIQNSRASFEDRPYLNETNDSPFSISSGSFVNGHSVGGSGILNGQMHNQENGGFPEDKSVWNTAVTWAKVAGQKLSQTEEEVWRRVNGEK